VYLRGVLCFFEGSGHRFKNFAVYMAPEHQSELIILLQIRTAVMYYNNKKVPAIVDLKNNPSMWHKAKSVTVPQVGNTAFRGKRK